MRCLRFALMVCLVALALGACGLNPSGTGTGTTLRVANLMPGTTAVTVSVSGTAFMTAAPFETFTGYQDISAGNYRFDILLGANPTPVFTTTNALVNVSAYTFIPYGPTTFPGGLLLDDTLFVHVPAGNFGFRLVNVSPTAGLIDAYVTGPAVDLSTASPVVSGLSYNSFSNFVNVPLGNYELRITRSGTKEVIFDSLLPAAPNSGGQTVVAYTRGSARLVNVALFTDGNAPIMLPNRLARLKAVNASAVASPLNLFVDGALTLANVPYTGVSNYQVIDAGTRTITVEASATPGAALLTTSSTFTPATDTSIALYGSAGAVGALILTDANVSTLTTKAQVRIRQRRGCARNRGCLRERHARSGRRRAERRLPVCAPRRARRGDDLPVRLQSGRYDDPRAQHARRQSRRNQRLHDLRRRSARRPAGHRRAGLLTAAPRHFARNARMASPCFATLNTPSRWPPSPSMTTTSATPPCAR